MTRVAAVLLLLLILSNAVPAGAAPSAATPPRQPSALAPEFMGMVIRDPWYDFGTYPGLPSEPNYAFQDTMGATLAAMGVRWVRLDFHIVVPLADATVDQTQQIDAEIAKNDYFINQVAPRNNLKVLALLSFDLLQATDAHELNSTTAENSKFGGGVNKYMHAWLTRALRIAERYRGNIAAYEVLNEQNRLPRYLPNGPVADAIAPEITGRLLTKFYRFCKNINNSNGDQQFCNADTKIILGGLHPRGTGNGPVPNPSDVDYLKQIYDDPTAFGDFKKNNGYFPVDGIGYHPYPEEIRQSVKDVYVDMGMNRMRAAIEAKDPGKQFWITEVGYNVGFDVDGPKGPTPQQTAAGQIAFMRDVYGSLYARGDVANVFWFKYEDFPPATGTNAQRWGVVQIPFTDGPCPGGACYNVNGTPALYRGSYLAYRELAGTPPNRTFLPAAAR
ncbi:MAG TPA: hypothetical protein VFU22_12450 [Roseiflexaceae bacterium]|nr:hypothetical protein [Roseiflexaceae bacterium]